jgi:hypothetical protein
MQVWDEEQYKRDAHNFMHVVELKHKSDRVDNIFDNSLYDKHNNLKHSNKVD